MKYFLSLRTKHLLVCLVLSGFVLNAKDFNLNWTNTVGTRTSPSQTQLYQVDAFGAVNDGKTLNTQSIQKAIDACSSAGGGIVCFSSGKYLTGAIFLKKGVHLIIPQGVTLLASTDIRDYPEMQTRVAGIEMTWPSALINVLNQKEVCISGNGVVHGQGKVFWEAYWLMRKEYEKKGLRWIVDYDCKRPRTILVSNSSDITIKDLTLKQAGFWTIQLLYSSYCTVDGVVIQNNMDGHGPSTDGIDIDSSSHILIQNCDVDCNDDNYCLKAGRDADGLRVNRPTEYVVIRNCIARSGGGLLTCGSETSGGIRYVLAEQLKAIGTSTGIRLKSAKNRGGTTEHIYVRNVHMDNVGIAFEATTNWNPAYSYSTLPAEYKKKQLPAHWKKMLEKVSEKKGIPYFKDVHLSDIKVERSGKLIAVAGSKQSVMENFSFSNVEASVESAGTVDFGKDWTFSNVQVQAVDTQPLRISNSVNVHFPALHAAKGADFRYRMPTKEQTSFIRAASSPEFTFLLPEMAGNLKFGLLASDNKSKWLSQLRSIESKKEGNKVIYTLSDPILGIGKLIITAVSLSDTDGLIIEVDPENISSALSFIWAFGGASGKIPPPDNIFCMHPLYCRNNVFSVEQSAFTLYFGESMHLRVIQGIMPVGSEIRLCNAYQQQTPFALFNSGKKTEAPALAGVVPLKNREKEYLCIYRQNDKADYNYTMLNALFARERK